MKKVIIIAEAGVNHNGSIELAKELVLKAAEAGADYVKFQTFKSEKCITVNAKKADYQIKNTKAATESQLEMVKKLELSPSNHLELLKLCNTTGIHFFSTAFDLDSIEFLAQLKIGLWKIPSGEITNYPYLKKIATYHQPVILSTAMA